MRVGRLLTAAVVLAALLGAGCTGLVNSRTVPGASTVLVVRHAERAAGADPDPPLSEAGRDRARALREVAADADVEAIYVTQYRRTRETGERVAEALGAEVLVRPVTAANLQTYAADLAAEIRSRHEGTTVLVIGHSNTVPAVVAAISGQDVAPIAEAEYDRLYRISIHDGGAIVLGEERFGAPTR